MKAEHSSHDTHAGLVSPEQVLLVRTEVQGQGADEEREDDRSAKPGESGDEHVNDSRTAALLGAVAACTGSLHGVQDKEGEDVKQREGCEENLDMHPDKGLFPGSPGDGLGQEVATEERERERKMEDRGREGKLRRQ